MQLEFNLFILLACKRDIVVNYYQVDRKKKGKKSLKLMVFLFLLNFYRITVNFLNRDGETFTVKAKVGETLLDTVIDNDVDIDGFGKHL